MRKFFLGLGLFVVAAIAEVALIVVIAGEIGVLATFGLMALTTILGVWLLSRTGPKSWRAIRAEVAENRPPTMAAADGLFALIACLLVVVPGFLTDAIGLTMLIPPVRRFVGDRVAGRLAQSLPPDLIGPVKVRAKRRRVRKDKHAPGDLTTPTVGKTSGGSTQPPPGYSGDTAAGYQSKPAASDEILEGEIVDDTVRS